MTNRGYDWSTRYIEMMIECSDLYRIADWVENCMDPTPTRAHAIEIASEIFEDLDYIKFHFTN